MSFKEVVNVMKDAGWGTLGTTDGRSVGVRPMGGWAWVDHELWCATFEGSDKVRQLRAVPNAEYCFCTKQGQHVRISGPCRVSSDDEEKRKLYELLPSLKNYIADPADPGYVVIKMKPECIRLMSTMDMTYRTVPLP